MTYPHSGRNDFLEEDADKSKDVKDRVQCLSWPGKAKLVVAKSLYKQDTDKISCYQYDWQSERKGIELQDCLPQFSLDSSCHAGSHHGNVSGHSCSASEGLRWFGAGEMTAPSSSYPMTSSVPMTQFASGSGHAWGSTVRGLFLSSAGVSLKMDDSMPLQLSMDDPKHGRGICMLSKK